MRIALIGDLQYWKAEVENLDYKMSQVKSFSPELSIVMGDFGGSCMRSTRGLEETKEYVSMIGCPFHAIFGNHDVEYWPDNINEYDPESTYRSVFGEEPYRSYIINGVLIICISIERQPFETMITPYTVYVSDEQYQRALNEIESHKDMPTVIIAHAPVAGSGLRCDRPMHNAALDTYLDQTFNARRWVELLKNNPQIKAWCSAHFHMGHDYDTAITYKNGVMHISCGVMTCCTRDESCNTRILDITEDQKLIVSTLDHNNDSELIWDATLDLTGKEKPLGRFTSPEDIQILLGDDRPERVWKCEKHGRYFISTKNGMLWEYDSHLCDLVGAVAYEKKVIELYLKDDRLVIGYDSGEYASVDLYSRGRWQYKETLRQEIRPEIGPAGKPLATVEYSQRSSKEGIYIIIK